MLWAVAVVLQLSVLFLLAESEAVLAAEQTTRSKDTSEDFLEQPGLLREL